MAIDGMITQFHHTLLVRKLALVQSWILENFYAVNCGYSSEQSSSNCKSTLIVYHSVQCPT